MLTDITGVCKTYPEETLDDMIKLLRSVEEVHNFIEKRSDYNIK